MAKSKRWQWIPTSLTLAQFEQFVLPHLLTRRRGPAPKLSLHGIFNYVWRLLHMGCQCNPPKLGGLGASPMSFAMVDIDFFKRVNDEWGHEAGDQALCHVAGILRGQVRAGELVARMGGEEFGIILLAGPDHAQLAAQRMCQAVEAAAFTYNAKTRTITISIGLAHLDDADDQSSALRWADAALYQAKQQGRNRVVVA